MNPAFFANELVGGVMTIVVADGSNCGSFHRKSGHLARPFTRPLFSLDTASRYLATLFCIGMAPFYAMVILGEFFAPIKSKCPKKGLRHLCNGLYDRINYPGSRTINTIGPIRFRS